jgi:hypothetical protein
MWRLLDGELPLSWKPRCVAISVGSSDLEAETCTTAAASQAVERIQQLVDFVLKVQPTTKVLLLAVLPKGVQWCAL